MASGQLTLTLPQLQALITSQLTSAKGSVGTSPATPTSSSQVTQAPPPSIPTVPPPPVQATILAYPCIWGTCKEIFEDNVDLGAHILRSNHILCEKDGYYCHWKGCPRTKEHNGKPFDTLQKITRHVKEVHMLRIIAQKVPIDQLGANYHRRGTFLKEGTLPETIPIQQHSQQPSFVTPPQPLLPIAQPIVSFDVTTVTPTPVSTVIPQALAASQLLNTVPTTSIQTITTTSNHTPSAPPSDQPVEKITTDTTPPSVFVPPPNNNREVVHSQIYLE